MPARKRQKAAVYARVSSTSQKDGSGIQRQKSKCKARAKDLGDTIAVEVSEVISGSLPLAERTELNRLMAKCKLEGINKIFVEGTRAFSRNAHVAETIYERSKELGVTLIPIDIPDLCGHSPNPAQKFMRRVMFAYAELEKDLAVMRLQHGWHRRLQQEKRKYQTGKQTVRLNQQGRVKINGRRSLLETNLSRGQRNKILKHMKDYQNGEVSVRMLAQLLSSELKLSKAMAPETARRLFSAM